MNTRTNGIMLILACMFVLTAGLPAQNAAPTTPKTTDDTPYLARVKGNDVNVRSGPADVYYPVTQLNAGQRVIVRKEFHGTQKWAQIDPTVGCFSYIAKEFIEPMVEKATEANGSAMTAVEPVLGRITADSVRVRAGSIKVRPENADQVQTLLNRGAIVEIIGQRDDYYKITPPDGCYFWISMEYLEKVGPLSADVLDDLEAERKNLTKLGAVTVESADSETADVTTAEVVDTTPSAETEEPAQAEPATRIAKERQELNVIVEQFKVVREKPIAEQALSDIREKLEALEAANSSASIKVNIDMVKRQLARCELAQDIYFKAQEKDQKLREALQKIDEQSAQLADQSRFAPRTYRTVIKGRLSVSQIKGDNDQMLFQIRDENENIIFYAQPSNDRLDLNEWLGEEISMAGLLRHSKVLGRQVFYVSSVSRLGDSGASSQPTPEPADDTQDNTQTEENIQ